MPVMMGEQSYFHRKFFHTNKSKRMKTQTKSSSSLSAATTTTTDPMGPVLECNGKDRRSLTDNNIERVGEINTTNANHSILARQRNQLIRQHSSISDRSRDSTRSSHSGNDTSYADVVPATTAADDCNEDGEEQNRAPGRSVSEYDAGGTDNDNNPPHQHTPIGAQLGQPVPTDHTETIDIHPEQPQAAASAASIRTDNTSPGKKSKLRTATRAILLFKRAASTLTHSDSSTKGPTSSRFQRPGGFSYPRSLVATFWRQNTADNSTCTRSSRTDSFASYNNSCNRSLASPAPAYLDGRTTSSSNPSELFHGGAGHNQPTASSSTFTLPRLIVPKMNALKLPIVCLIKSLDGELIREVSVHRYELGQYLMDSLKVSLGMVDAKYFGLKLARSVDEQEDVGQPWLDLNEPVYKQISKHSKLMTTITNGPTDNCSESGRQVTLTTATATKSVDLYLRIKFYPPNLARIQEQFLRQYLWLQLRRDLRLGRLTSSMNSLSFLMACTLQYELGDFVPEYVSDKLCDLNILPNQDLVEQQAIEIWRKRLVGTKRHQSQMQFLRESIILQTYGFDYYSVRDHQRQRAYLLGFNYAGIKTIRNERIVHHFRWHNLSKISYERRMIIFHVYPSENSKRKQILGFKCLSNEECQNLHMRLLEQKYFFTVDLVYFDKSPRCPSHLAESSVTEHEQLLGRADRWPAQDAADRRESGGVQADEYNDDAREPEEREPRTSNASHQNQTEPLKIANNNSGYNSAEVAAQASKHQHQHQHQHLDTLTQSGVQKSSSNTCDCANCARGAQIDQRQHQLKQHTSNNQSLDSASSSGRQSINTDQLVKCMPLQGCGPASYSPTAANCCPTGGNLSPDPNSPSAPPAQYYYCDGPQMSSTSIGDPHYDELPRGSEYPRDHGRALEEPGYPSLRYADGTVRDLWRGERVQDPSETISLQASGSEFKTNRPASSSFLTQFQLAQHNNYHDTRGSGSTAAAPLPIGQRVVHLAEQILTLPARLFGSTSMTPPLHYHYYQAHTLATDPIVAQGVQGNILVQALIFGVFILVMNIVLRLGDAISVAVIDLLSFKSSGLDAADQQQPNFCSPLLDSFGGGGGGTGLLPPTIA